MKKITVIFVLLFSMLVTSSCRGDKIFLPRMSEISNLEIARIIGIDTIDGEIVVTIVVSRGSSSGEGGWSGETATGIASFTGETVYEAISEINVYSDRRLNLGYVDFLIIGEDAAREDIVKHLDFFGRDKETRYTVQVFLARDSTAKDFLNNTASESRSIVDMLANIEETISETNDTRKVKLIELLSSLATPQTASVVPALALEDAEVAFPVGGEKPKKTFAPAGFGIIVDDKLVGFFEKELASAYNFLTEQVHVVPISIIGTDGERVAVQAVTDRLVFEPEWDGDTLKSVKYNVMVGATIVEQNGHVDVVNEETLQKLKDQISERVRDDFEQVINIAQEAGVDSLDIGDRLRMKNPIKWSKISENWDEIFPELDIIIDVKSQIHRSPDMREAVDTLEETGKEEKND